MGKRTRRRIWRRVPRAISGPIPPLVSRPVSRPISGSNSRPVSRSISRPASLFLLLVAGSIPVGASDAALTSRGVRSGPLQGPAAAPNILVIITDDQREGLEVMPATRRLFVEQGRSYPAAYVTTPLCCPARASVMTGKYVHNHGVLSNGVDDWRDLDHATTMQRYLHETGYRTGHFGKLLNHWPVRRDPPYFDRWALLPDAVRRLGYYGSDWNVNGDVRRVDTYSTTFIRRQVIQFLRTSEGDDGQPWYAYVATAAPHRAFVAEPKYRDAPVPEWPGNPAVAEEDRSDKPAYVREQDISFERGKEIRRAQYRTLMSVDDMVRSVFSTLEELGEQNTLAIYLSDSGYMWSEHGLNAKQVPYVQSVKIPMMMRWPTLNIAGQDARMVTNVDVAPTVLAAAGLPFQGDGRNLLDPTWTRERVLIEYFGDPHAPSVPRWASLLRRDAQYVEYYEDAGSLREVEFYDLLADPWQLDNLGRAPGSTWRDQLAADRRCAGSSCP